VRAREQVGGRGGETSVFGSVCARTDCTRVRDLCKSAVCMHACAHRASCGSSRKVCVVLENREHMRVCDVPLAISAVSRSTNIPQRNCQWPAESRTSAAAPGDPYGSHECRQALLCLFFPPLLFLFSLHNPILGQLGPCLRAGITGFQSDARGLAAKQKPSTLNPLYTACNQAPRPEEKVRKKLRREQERA
jgi:hypothetical protein